jgi:FHA domain
MALQHVSSQGIQIGNRHICCIQVPRSMDENLLKIILLIPSCLLLVIVLYEYFKGRKKSKTKIMDDFKTPDYREEPGPGDRDEPRNFTPTPAEDQSINAFRDPKKTMVGDVVPSREEPKNKLTSLAGFLVSFSAQDEGEFWVLREGNHAIGSAHSNDIVLSEKHVSGSHGMINVSADSKNNCWKFQIVDKSSSNGTFVNGERLEIFVGRILMDKDRIKIGEYELMLCMADRFAGGLGRNPAFISSKADVDYSANQWQPQKK